MEENEQNLCDLYVGLIINGLHARKTVVSKVEFEQAFDTAEWMVEERQRRIDQRSKGKSK